MNDPKPNPGSEEAIAAGCKCPVLDNAHGKGYMGVAGVFVFNGNCPLHAPHDDSDLDGEQLGAPACQLGEACESCQ